MRSLFGLLPQFIDLHSGTKVIAFLILGLTFIFNGTLWCMIVVWFASWPSGRRAEGGLDWVLAQADDLALCLWDWASGWLWIRRGGCGNDGDWHRTVFFLGYDRTERSIAAAQPERGELRSGISFPFNNQEKVPGQNGRALSQGSGFMTSPDFG